MWPIAEKGLVIIDEPDGIAITMTPDAATQTGESLISAANVTREQAQAPDADEAV
jgi:hypothetical protein